MGWSTACLRRRTRVKMKVMINTERWVDCSRRRVIGIPSWNPAFPFPVDSVPPFSVHNTFSIDVAQLRPSSSLSSDIPLPSPNPRNPHISNPTNNSMVSQYLAELFTGTEDAFVFTNQSRRQRRLQVIQSVTIMMNNQSNYFHDAKLIIDMKTGEPILIIVPNRDVLRVWPLICVINSNSSGKRHGRILPSTLSTFTWPLRILSSRNCQITKKRRGC